MIEHWPQWVYLLLVALGLGAKLVKEEGWDLFSTFVAAGLVQYLLYKGGFYNVIL